MPSSTSTTPTRLLLVDDEQHNLRAATRLLKRRPGCEIQCAQTAAEARAILAAGPIDVVLVDEHLAVGSSGRALLREVGESWPHIRRVLWTGSSSDTVPPEAQDVLNKPFTLEELYDTLFKDSSAE